MANRLPWTCFEVHVACIEVRLPDIHMKLAPLSKTSLYSADSCISPTTRGRQWVIFELLDEIQERSSRSTDLDIVLNGFEHIPSRPLLRQQGRKRIPWHGVGRFPRCTIGEFLLGNNVNVRWSPVDSFQSGDEILSCRGKLDERCDFRLSHFGIRR